MPIKYKIVPTPKMEVVEEKEEEELNDRIPVKFTRYLYIKEEVLVSLVLSILEKQKEEALFWAYELFNSGYQECVMDFMISIYREMFRAHNPKLEKFMNARYNEWKENGGLNKNLGTMVLNLCDPTRKFNVDGFITREFPPISKTKDSTFYMMFDETAVKKYDHITGVIPRKLLETACLYSTKKNGNVVFGCSHAELPADQLKDALFYNWVYYASFSPIWEERILKSGGTICHDSKTVEFSDPDEFYDIYGYEPDEQKPTLIKKLTHFDEEMDQMTPDEFISTYNKLGNII